MSRTQSDVIEKIPGFRISGESYNTQVLSSRGATTCKPNIVIDGFENQSINDVPAAQIGAIAAYRDGEIVPGFYGRGCGAILIWTVR